MNASKLLGTIAVVAIVVAAVAFGVMSDHARDALRAIHMTHGLWIIGKVAIVAVSAAGLLVARVYKACRPADTTSAVSGRGPDAPPHPTAG
jgi:hypothetical protein